MSVSEETFRGYPREDIGSGQRTNGSIRKLQSGPFPYIEPESTPDNPHFYDHSTAFHLLIPSSTDPYGLEYQLFLPIGRHTQERARRTAWLHRIRGNSHREPERPVIVDRSVYLDAEDVQKSKVDPRVSGVIVHELTEVDFVHDRSSTELGWTTYAPWLIEGPGLLAPRMLTDEEREDAYARNLASGVWSKMTDVTAADFHAEAVRQACASTGQSVPRRYQVQPTNGIEPAYQTISPDVDLREPVPAQVNGQPRHTQSDNGVGAQLEWLNFEGRQLL